ncbi:MAG: ABC transporter ATP-binding protein [Deltaproteobacteria bacterium]|nr:MAG: ABC transporter ATP-binding protein [Deltaproteobacteria bacterium]
MKPLLETRGVTKRFGAVVAAEKVNVQVREGEVVGIIGANGAGKTTFVNIITGYVKPTSGRVLFDGQDITGLPPRKVIRKGICRSFQIPQLFPDLTVEENLLVACTLLNRPFGKLLRPFHDGKFIERVEEALEKFHIKDYRHEPAGTLPQGVKKLLDIAMAMMGKTRLILLDEPTSGVAIDEKFPLMDTIVRSVGRNGTTTIFIEHDMEVVEHYAERVIAFYDGKVIADGETSRVLRNEDVVSFITGSIPTARREPADADS